MQAILKYKSGKMLRINIDQVTPFINMPGKAESVVVPSDKVTQPPPHIVFKLVERNLQPIPHVVYEEV